MFETKRYTLLIILDERRGVLFAMKKRGWGKGRWNGYGGKIHKDEPVEEALKREVLEEAGVEPVSPQKMRVILFTLEPEHKKAEVHIFRASGILGEPRETEEMRPEWFSADAIPYDQMWEGDALWLPMLLAGKKFQGTISYHNDRLVSHELQEAS